MPLNYHVSGNGCPRMPINMENGCPRAFGLLKNRISTTRPDAPGHPVAGEEQRVYMAWAAKSLVWRSYMCSGYITSIVR